MPLWLNAIAKVIYRSALQLRLPLTLVLEHSFEHAHL